MSEIMAGREQLEENLEEEAIEIEQKASFNMEHRLTRAGLAMEEDLFGEAALSSDWSESEDEDLQSLGQLCGVQCVHIKWIMFTY